MTLTKQTIDKMTLRDDWGGWGYLGERERSKQNAEMVNRADTMLLNHAVMRGLTEEELFQWANSKDGRWYGDCWFGAWGQHAEKYLP